ncbi:MAG: flagellar biosynthesis protein FliQ [Aquificaceae bacterium]|nr:flagellar biosynthesis protein FliQ [Aquificaceae bacterium]MCS7196311.1 flagellar biosynthesis protein FliQ [Aquificaceae bacterium]MCX7989292.1 flagellar biosynthesis protein FliQ [Aquificaceae bacterium]MDW8032050.1 flagellar biosynthesis protein FliQ [Aquificaceae bacterium]
MSPDMVISLGQKALEMALMLSAPVLIATFLVGLVISILQSATQIQEMTLSYIPKIIAAYLTVLILGAWMLGKLLDYTKELIINIPSWLR